MCNVKKTTVFSIVNIFISIVCVLDELQGCLSTPSSMGVFTLVEGAVGLITVPWWPIHAEQKWWHDNNVATVAFVGSATVWSGLVNTELPYSLWMLEWILE